LKKSASMSLFAEQNIHIFMLQRYENIFNYEM